MKKSMFLLSGKVTISVYTEVVAETLEDAIKEAEPRQIEHLTYGDDALCKYAWVTDEYDGEVFDIHEE